MRLFLILLFTPLVSIASQGTNLTVTHVPAVTGAPPSLWNLYCGASGFDVGLGQATYTASALPIGTLNHSVGNTVAGLTDGVFECLTRSCNGVGCSVDSPRTVALTCGSAASLPSGTCDDGSGQTQVPDGPAVPGVNFSYP